MEPYFGQSAYRIRFERGERGLRAVGHDAAVIVIVDVLSFSTAIDVAIAAGASVKPIPMSAGAEDEAEKHGAFRAVARSESSEAMPYSLSPQSLSKLPAGSRLILPSPNGAMLTACAQDVGAQTVLVGCLRNASAVAAFASERANGGIIAVISAGERWPDASLRPALEDDLGAGAILSSLDLHGASPEAIYAAYGFREAREHVRGVLEASVSGLELIEWGYGNDVERAAELDVSRAVATAFVRSNRRGPDKTPRGL